MITLKTSGFEEQYKKLRALVRASGVTMQDVANETMRIALQNAMKLTYPKTGNQGRARVQTDVRKLIVPYNSVTATPLDSGWTLIQWQPGNDATAYQEPPELMAAGGSVSSLRSYHERFRNKRGRVTGAPKLNKDRVHAKASMLRQYIAGRKKRVGRLKKGWLPALQHFASAAGTSPKGVPPWVANNPAPAQGHYSGHISKYGRGAIEAHNDVPYMRDDQNDWIIKTATATAQKFLTKRARLMLLGTNGLVARFNSGRRLAA